MNNFFVSYRFSVIQKVLCQEKYALFKISLFGGSQCEAA